MEMTETFTLDVEAPGTTEGVSLEASTAPNSLQKLGLLLPADVDRLCAQQHHSKAFVEDFISHGSVSVLIGDSGLGKSPLAYQLGLCVAAGLPFLGLKTQGGPVVYADYENGLRGSQDLRNALIGFLGLQKAPDDFILWTPDCALRSVAIEDVCREVEPLLFILDSLRSHDPYFEQTDHAGASMASLRSMASKHCTAILAIHHTRKPGPEGVPRLDQDETVLMEWLNQAAGHRSIINQSDTRVAAAEPGAKRGGDMILRWHRRIYGEGGPIYLERVCDDDGQPIGYRRIVGAGLLGNPEQEAAFARLKEEFTFREAKATYGRRDDPTRKWLLKSIQVGILTQEGRGVYRKLLPPGTHEQERGVASAIDSTKLVE